MIMTIDPQGTQQIVQKAKEDRRDRLNKSQNMIVGMRPEFVQALNNSLNFSRQKGRSAFLLKPGSQRKRRHKEIEEVKQEEQQLNQSKQNYLQQNKRVRQEMSSLQEQLEELNEYKQLVMHLHQSGIINEDGNPLFQNLNQNDNNNDMQ
ncbi:hypothetical protein OXYTRIMIC_063 [Oxytricha trifallax]|uniref:Uncharacterized protein n=1 Tax=Oxytricha trifallax TaxID=1172189 RepID=A0A073HX44_9SPIT|nr:hypothetical protein OXYTRIMIC_063 [Oxytricha trifallax]